MYKYGRIILISGIVLFALTIGFFVFSTSSFSVGSQDYLKLSKQQIETIVQVGDNADAVRKELGKPAVIMDHKPSKKIPYDQTWIYKNYPLKTSKTFTSVKPQSFSVRFRNGIVQNLSISYQPIIK